MSHKEKQWRCNQKARTRLTVFQKSVQAESARSLPTCSCMAFPCCLIYTQQRSLWLCVIVKKVRNLVEDECYMEHSAIVRDAHKRAIERKKLARHPPEDRLAAQQEAQFTRCMKALPKFEMGQTPQPVMMMSQDTKSSKHVPQACQGQRCLQQRVACCILLIHTGFS